MKDIITQLAAKVNKVAANESGNNNLTGSIVNILNGIITALGLVAVVVMIIGGVNYMTSSGDTAKVEKAKKTILYGAIGLIICVLSFAIVNFVIDDIINHNKSTTNQESESYIPTLVENDIAFINK